VLLHVMEGVLSHIRHAQIVMLPYLESEGGERWSEVEKLRCGTRVRREEKRS
jgi:hypothetical protein